MYCFCIFSNKLDCKQETSFDYTNFGKVRQVSQKLTPFSLLTGARLEGENSKSRDGTSETTRALSRLDRGEGGRGADVLKLRH
jgi:hypothetical protein